MRLLITGASGFIGRAVLSEARKLHLDFVACARQARELDGTIIHALDFCTLTDQELAHFLQRYHCTHLLHLAWGVQAGFWHSPDNLTWVSHTIRLTRAFLDGNGTAIIATGSCAEYATSGPGPWHEESPVRGESLYAKCKIATHDILQQACAKAKIRFAWARVAFPYGPHEPSNKFISSQIELGRSNTPIIIREPDKRVDYVHVADVAKALLTLVLHEKAHGSYNVATGASIRLADLVHTICELLDVHPPITALPAQSQDCLLSNERLCLLGWQPLVSLNEGLNSMISMS